MINFKNLKSKINTDNIVSIIFVILLISFLGTKIITNSNFFNKEVVKEINEVNKKQFAMYIEDGENYKEYTDSDKFPIGYTLNIGKSKCEDISGNNLDVNNILSNNGNSVTVKSNKTVYCTLYFDYKGTGEKDKPYRIQYIEDLVELSKAVNDEENHYEGQYFYLERDLDFREEGSYRDYKTTKYGDINGNSEDEELKTELTSGSGWEPIGLSQELSFQGNFDGNGKTIANIYINNTKIEETYRFGLFGYLENGTISNLNVNGEIATTLMVDIGGIVGGITNATIDSCESNVKITSNVGRYSLGGIVGATAGEKTSIKNCINRGTISGGNNTGGIVGVTDGNLVIDDCHNYGEIINALGTQAGGLVGRDNATTNETTITNSHNEGNVSDTNNFAGGIMGRVYGNLKISNSYNDGIVNAFNYAGGIVGYITNLNTIIDSCHNTGNITVSNTNTDSLAKGIIGAVSGSSTSTTNVYVINCYNTGTITSPSSSSGLLQSSNYANTYVLNSYNTGKIVASNYATGIFLQGGIYEKTAYINNVYNIGEISNAKTRQAITWLNTSKTTVKSIGNAYYENSISSGSNMTGSNINLTSMPLANMKNRSFVTTLNTNRDALNKAGLSSIDSNLNGYTLRKWVFGPNNYPVLANEAIKDLSGKGGIAEYFGVKHDSEGITTSTDEQHLGHIDLGFANQSFDKALTYVARVRINKEIFGTIIGNHNSAGATIQYNLTPNKLSFSMYSEEHDEYISVTTSKGIEIGKWYTVIGTYDGNNIKIYLNGELMGSEPTSDTIKPSNTSIVLGGNPGGANTTYIESEYVYATYSDALVFNRALTQEEIKANYSNIPDPQNKTNLLAWYKFSK